MFCENCGNKIEDGVKFCEKCGTPVNASQPGQPPVQQPPVTPAQTQYTPPQDQAQYMPPQDQAQYMPQQDQAQYASKPPRKPLSPKVKKIILFCGIGAVVLTVGLILLFTVIIPSANKVDVSKYVAVSLDNSKKVYDGDISGRVYISDDNLFIDRLGDESVKKLAESEKKISDGSYSYEDLYNDISQYSNSSEVYAKKSAVSDIVSSLEVDCKIKDQEESTTDSSEGSSDSYGSARFKNAKKSDTLVVTIKWPTDEFKLKRLDQLEAVTGLNFDKNDKTVEFKLEDKLTDSQVEIRDKVIVDFVKVINDKQLITTIGTPENYPKAELVEFEYTEGDYKFTNSDADESSSHDRNKIKVTSTKDSSLTASFYVSFDSVRQASEGDEINYEINSGREQLEDTDVFFKETKAKFKYSPNHPLTLDEAKSNATKITAAITEDIKSIDSSIKNSKDFSVAEIDYVTSKDNSDKDPVVYLYYKNASTGKFKEIQIIHSYIRGDEFFYGDANDSWSSYESLQKCKESSSPFSKYSADNYSATKIQ